jgi:hypothetical protein
MIDPFPFRSTMSWPLAIAVPLLIGALLLGCGPHGQETLDLSGPAAAKVDPALTRTATQLLAAGHGDSLIAVLVRVKSPGAETALAGKGMQVDSVIEDVATGRVAPRSLAGLAALADVVMIEPTHKLEIK